MAEINSTENQESAVETPGVRLRAAREIAQYTLEQASRHLHLDVSTIESIEADQFPPHIPATYLKGYLRAYAKWLDLPADEIVASFNRADSPQSSLTGLQSLSSLPEGGARSSKKVFFGALLFIGLAVIAAALYYFVPSITAYMTTDSTEQVPSSSKAVEATAATETVVNATEGEISLNLAPSETPVAAPSSAENVINGSVSLTPVAVASDAKKNTNATDEDIVAGLPGTAELLQLSFTGDCWVRVTDANGEVLAVGIKQRGHRFRVQGPAPLTVVLGNPTAVELSHNGRPVDLSRYPGGSPATVTIETAASE